MTNERLIEIMELAIHMLRADLCDIDGLCLVSSHLFRESVITEDEKRQFKDYVRHNAPQRRSAWNWPPFRHAPRIEWLQQQIQTLKTQQ